MIFPKDPIDNLAYTARRSGLWVPTPLRYGARKCCCCPHCYGEAPSEWEVTIGGMRLKEPEVCADCLNLNDSFVVTDVYVHYYSGVGIICRWRYWLPSELCGIAYVQLDLSNGSHRLIQVRLFNSSGILQLYWSKDYGSSITCLDVENDQLTFVSSYMQNQCDTDFPRPTCHLSAA